MIDVVFNGFDFNSNGIKVREVRHENAPERTLSTGTIAGRDGFSLLEDKFAKKIIVVTGTIIANDRAQLNDLLNTFKGAVIVSNKAELGIHDEISLYWDAVIQKLEIPREYYNDSHVDFSIEFLADPFSVDGIRQVITESAITTSPFTGGYTITGTAEPFPDFKITVNSATSLTLIKFSILTTGDEISISDTYSASDVIIISTNTKTVFINGVEAAYEGVFPTVIPGVTNYVRITTTATARNLDLEISYLPKYL